MKYALIFFILIYTKSCNSQKSTAESLDGIWKITSIENKKIANIDATKCIINSSENSLAISVGCNNHMADFKIIKDKIQINNVFATEKYCPDLSFTEKRLWDNLPIISDYKLENNTLTLINLKGETAITLVR